MHAGDSITDHQYVTPARDGMHITVTDLTTGRSGTIVLNGNVEIDTSETTTTTAVDTLTVQAGSTTLATYGNLNHNSGYVQESFNLASVAGQTVTIKFTGTEESSLQTSFVIDDTALNVS